MGDLAGDNLEYVRRTIGYANAHYPERSYVIYLVNAPIWFSILWRVVRPLVHPNTQKKVRILTKSDTLNGMQEHIDISNIPEYYGGQLDFGGYDSCRYGSPEVIDLNNFVQRVNEGRIQPGNNFDLDNDKNKLKNKNNTPPGQPGEYYTVTPEFNCNIASSRSSDNSQSSNKSNSNKYERNNKLEDRELHLESELDRDRTRPNSVTRVQGLGQGPGGPAMIPSPRPRSVGHYDITSNEKKG